MEGNLLSRFDANATSINLDHLINFFLKYYFEVGFTVDNGQSIIKGDNRNGANIYLSTCVVANLRKQVVNNAKEGLTWPRGTREQVEYEQTLRDMIASNCWVPTDFEEGVRNSGRPNLQALYKLREYDETEYDEEEYTFGGGRKKIKNTKKKGNKKYSKKKRGKKQTKKRRMRKRSKNKLK